MSGLSYAGVPPYERLSGAVYSQQGRTRVSSVLLCRSTGWSAFWGSLLRGFGLGASWGLFRAGVLSAACQGFQAFSSARLLRCSAFRGILVQGSAFVCRGF